MAAHSSKAKYANWAPRRTECVHCLENAMQCIPVSCSSVILPAHGGAHALLICHLVVKGERQRWRIVLGRFLIPGLADDNSLQLGVLAVGSCSLLLPVKQNLIHKGMIDEPG